VQGYRNLIELKILPHVGWDEDTEKYISEIEQILEGGGNDAATKYIEKTSKMVKQ